MLQFGHGGDAVENGEPHFLHFWIVICFNSATAVMPWKTPSVAVDRVHRLVLQFGHGGDAVENGGIGGSTGLPFGRFNSATAVMPWKTGLRPEAAGNQLRFNSATAVMPWKTSDLRS